MSGVTVVTADRIHQPRAHAAVRTGEYVFSQLIPYIGNKRKLLHVIDAAVRHSGCRGGLFVDLFTGSTVVARWAKKQGFAVLANDWEPYACQIARGTVALNAVPAFKALGGAAAVFDKLNALRPLDGYVSTHLCPFDDAAADPLTERMFFTRANGMRIDAIREQLAQWHAQGKIDDDELAYVLAALIYAVSYASNTSGVFKGYHHGWGGRTGTALYRILAPLTLSPPLLHDNDRTNLATQADAQALAGRLTETLGRTPDIVYIDPPYNQHPYGSNYHVLNTVALWDKPALGAVTQARGNKAAIRTDWRTSRRSAYNHASQAAAAFADLIATVQARHILVSYSTDGTIPLAEVLAPLAARGALHVFTQAYKRYRVSTPRMSAKSHTVEFVAACDTAGTPQRRKDVERMSENILQQEQRGRGRAGLRGFKGR
ncbi:MAG: DNA adenine methylase [Planctomycetaceae bacterium]|nr:DNA adenine methylase [Planctomycetaceae bacterium]